MFGNKRFDVNDSTTQLSTTYDIPGLYELIFKRIPDDLFYMEDDMSKYKSMLLATNALKHKHHSEGIIRKSIIEQQRIQVQIRNRAVDVDHIQETKEETWKGIISCNEHAIDYVHWDDPNELVDCVRLLDASPERAITLMTTRCCRSSRNFAKLVLL